MKTITLLFAFVSAFSFGQSYDLLPDTCTACSYLYTTGTSETYPGVYYLHPENDTIYMGNSYIKMEGIWGAAPSIIGFRQSGNKVLGAISDSLQEVVLQDWDALIGDTVYNLFSNGIVYDAVFMVEDSMILNDNTYHHTRGMKGIGYYDYSNNYQTMTWDINWHERGLCAGNGLPNALNTAWGAGGIQYNLAIYPCLCTVYTEPKPYTSDTRYNLSSGMDSCVVYLWGIDELENNKITVYPNPTNGIIYFDLQGQSTNHFQLVDSRGIIILQKTGVFDRIDLSDYDNGLYFLSFQTGNGRTKQARIFKVE